MVTRIDKSSKSRNGTEYLLLWRTAKQLGPHGFKTIDKAINGDEKAMARIEKLAYTPRKKPALVAWIKKQISRLKREKAINLT